MKKTVFIFLSITLLLASCGRQPSSETPAQTQESETVTSDTLPAGSDPAPSAEPEEDSASTESGALTESSTPTESGTPTASNILIAYFSVPEDVDPSGADAISGASIVVRDGEVSGNVQFMAEIIQETVGGDLFRIETVQEYPLEHEALVDFAADEQDAEARPELATHAEQLEQYDIVFLGYPNWWGDMPMPLYTFLEECDLSGKTIIPFCPHGGSGFSRTERTIAELQPNAVVSENGMSISRNNVAAAEDEIIAWAEGLGLPQ